MIEKTEFSVVFATAAAAAATAVAKPSLLTWGVPGAVLRALSWIESKVELPPEEGPVICVDELKDALVHNI